MRESTRMHMTVADLRAALEAAPDWATVEVVTFDEMDLPESHDRPYFEYRHGVFTIETD